MTALILVACSGDAPPAGGGPATGAAPVAAAALPEPTPRAATPSDSGSSASGIAARSTPLNAPLAVRDSAGVRIVEHGDPSAARTALRIDPTPVYRMGWAPGEHEWALITSGTLLSGGRAAILDPMASQVVVLDAGGGIETILGRAGEGPGELGRFPMTVRTVGADTIVVQDLSLSRMSFFHAGRFVRSIPTRVFDVAQRGDGHGNLFLAGRIAWKAGFTEDWVQMPLLRLDLASGRADTVGSVDFVAHRRITRGNIFHGRGSAVAWAGGFVTGRRDRAELVWRDGSGRTTQIVRWRPRAVPLTEEVWAAHEASLRETRRRMAGMPNVMQSSEAEFERTLADFEANARGPLPEYGGFLADATGRIWIAHLREDATNHTFGDSDFTADRYDVIGPDGAWLGTVEMPRHLEILDIDGSHLLARERNELDVHAVSVYRIQGGD